MDKFGKPIKNVNPLLKEFRDFAMRGNVIDLAVGVIIGAAFGKIVDALVTNVVMPPLSLLTGDIDLSDRVLILSRQSFPDLKAARDAHAPMINYGVFLNSVIRELHNIHLRPHHQQDPSQARPSARTAEERLPFLFVQHTASGHALSTLHLHA